jgi:hypothetical protein
MALYRGSNILNGSPPPGKRTVFKGNIGMVSIESAVYNFGAFLGPGFV